MLREILDSWYTHDFRNFVGLCSLLKDPLLHLQVPDYFQEENDKLEMGKLGWSDSSVKRKYPMKELCHKLQASQRFPVQLSFSYRPISVL